MAEVGILLPGPQPFQKKWAAGVDSCTLALQARGLSASLRRSTNQLRKGPVAQKNRAPVFETGGRRFESCLARQIFFHSRTGVTQPGECGASNPDAPVRLRSPVPDYRASFNLHVGRVAQPGQSVCLTSRGSKVQILSRPPTLFFRCRRP